MRSSSELQFVVLSSLAKDSDMMTRVSNDINTNFFTDSKYQYIFKLLMMYYTSYEKVPTLSEASVMATQYYQEPYGDLNDIQTTLTSLYTAPASDPKFVEDKITEFVKRSKFENILVKMVDRFNKSKDFDVEDTIDEINKTYEYTIRNLDVYNPGDYDSFLSAKTKALGSIQDPRIIRSCLDGLNRSLQYRGYKYGDLSVVVAAPGTGKTSFLVNEGITAAMQGYNVCHIFLGDMNEYSASLRYMSSLTKTSMSVFSDDPMAYQNMLVNHPTIKMFKPLDRVRFLVQPPGEMSTNQLVSAVKKIQNNSGIHFDMIIVDYADNLAEESLSSSYENGGKIYNKLKALAVTNHSVVITASQPKRQYFESEIIPFDGLAESSKKQHVVDMCITLGSPRRGCGLLTAFCAKLREGETGALIRIKADLSKCSITEISNDEYLSYRAELMDPNSAESNVNGIDDRKVNSIPSQE